MNTRCDMNLNRTNVGNYRVYPSAVILELHDGSSVSLDIQLIDRIFRAWWIVTGGFGGWLANPMDMAYARASENPDWSDGTLNGSPWDDAIALVVASREADCF